MDTEMLYLNGAFMPLSEGRVPVEDRGFQLGDGVYEVVKVMSGRLVWLDDHLERLGRSLEAVGLSDAIAGHRLAEVLPELVARSGIDHGMTYIQVTRGSAPREFVFPRPQHPTVLAYARSTDPPEKDEILAGTALHPMDDLRWARCDIKSVSLLASVLAKEEARSAGAQEALFVGPGGIVCEGGSSNVFAVLEGVLRTHPLGNRILAGVTRKHVLQIARAAGRPVEERAFGLGEVASERSSASEVFTASTMRGVMPVVRIGTHVVGDGRPGPVTLAILNAVCREQALCVGLEPPRALT